MSGILGGLARQLRAAVLQALTTPPPGTSAALVALPPRQPRRSYARPGPRTDGLTADQAALAAAQHAGLSRQLDTAMREGLGVSRMQDACLVLKHAPDLAAMVTAGQLPLAHAALIGRLRRDVPRKAAAVEARYWRMRDRDGDAGSMLRGAWRANSKYRADWHKRNPANGLGRSPLTSGSRIPS